jgi:hypothetical protein
MFLQIKYEMFRGLKTLMLVDELNQVPETEGTRRGIKTPPLSLYDPHSLRQVTGRLLETAPNP